MKKKHNKKSKPCLGLPLREGQTMVIVYRPVPSVSGTNAGMAITQWEVAKVYYK